MAQVTITDVQKVYGHTTALEGFTVTVKDGEFVTFLGPSGCGKTTSLRLVAGFIRPERGSIRIAERTVSDAGKGVFVPPEDRGVGMVFQSYAVWPHMNVFKNVAYPLKIKKVPRADMVRKVEQALELVKMPELIDRYPNQLSGGQQQRVALARALVMTPQVLPSVRVRAGGCTQASELVSIRYPSPSALTPALRRSAYHGLSLV